MARPTRIRTTGRLHHHTGEGGGVEGRGGGGGAGTVCLAAYSDEREDATVCVIS